MRLLMSALFGFALMAGPCLAQARDPLVRAGATQKISDHVHVILDDDVAYVPNIGIIVGSRAALIVDTGLGDRNGRTVLAEVQKVAPGRALYIVTTHVHPEHDLGANAFPAEAKMIRSNDQVKEIGEDGLAMRDRFATITPLMGELLRDATFRKADITFDKEHALDLGGVTARIYAMGANHTRGDTAIFVAPDRVLFSGDVAMKKLPFPFTSASSFAHWRESLDRFDAMNPRLVVPSHSGIGEGAALSAEYRRYFTAVETAVAAAKRRGETLEQATKSVTAELAPQFPGAAVRIENAVRVAYSERR